MFKNVAGQKVAVFAWDTVNRVPKTGDAANITAKISLDCADPASSNDVNPTELDATDAPGIYVFDVTQAETNVSFFILYPHSTTTGISILPVFIYPVIQQTGDSYAIVNHADYGNAKLVRSTTPANALDVSATGEAGLDFANIKAASAPTTLSNITVPTVTTVGTLTTYTGNTPQTGDAFARLGAPAGASVSADVLQIKNVTDAITAEAAAKLATSAGTIISAAAASGTLSTTQMTTNLTEATNDHYNNRIIIWTSGVLQNQATNIVDYDGTSKLLTFTAVTEAPTAGDTFIIV